ncbi:MAG: MFS transporter [Anaerovibrio sp.]|nr:MFS transporter [Anaerovibrio sp.]
MQKKYLYGIAAIHFSNDISSGALPAVLPFFVLNYGLDYASMAGLMFASACLSSVIQPLFGFLSDKTSKMWFMPLGVFMTGTSLAIAGFVESYWSIFTAVVFLGIGTAIFHPEAASLVNQVSGSKKGSGMSIFSVGGNGGFGIGPLLAVAVITTFGMHGLAVFGIIGVVMGLVALYVIPRIKESALEKLEEAEAGNPSPQASEPGTNDWHAFGKLTLVTIFRSIVFVGISSFLPIFCIHVLGASPVMGSSTLSIMSISGIVMTLIGGYAADRWGYIKVLRAGLLMLIPFMAIAFFGGNIWWVYAMLLPIAFAMFITYSPVVVLGQTYLGKNLGVASGITLGIALSAGGVAVPFLGKYGDIYGLESVMMILVIIAALCAFFSFFLPQPGKKSVL